MNRRTYAFFAVAFLIGVLCLAPINNPPGGTGATGPAGPSGSPGPQGSPGPNTIASTTAVLKGDNAGGAVAATANTDYSNPAGVQALIDAAVAGKGVIGTVKLNGVLNGNIGEVESSDGPFDPLTTGYSMSSGILTATFTASLADAHYFPDVAFIRTGTAMSARVEATSVNSVSFRFYDVAGDPTDNPDQVWMSLQKRSQ